MGDVKHDVSVSYLTDPLSALAKVPLRIAAGLGVPPVVIEFENEPGAHCLQIKHRDPREVSMFWTDRDDCDPANLGKPVSQASVDSVGLAICVGRVLEGLLRGHGLIGYRRKWVLHDFPLAQYIHLRLLLDASDEAEAAVLSASLEHDMALLASPAVWGARQTHRGVQKWDLPL